MDKQQRTIIILLTTLAVIIGISAVLSELFDTSRELASIATWTPERRTAAPRTDVPKTLEPSVTPSPTLADPTATPRRSSCVYPEVYWLATADKLPAQVAFRGFRFTRETVISILFSPAQEETTTLLQQFIITNLNIASGSDPTDLGLTLDDAEEWLNLHPMGSLLSDTDRQVGALLVVTLKKFNNGELGPGLCSFVLPATRTPTSTPTPTITRTRVYIPPRRTSEGRSTPIPQPPTPQPPTPQPPTPKPATNVPLPTDTPIPTPTTAPTETEVSPPPQP